MPKWFCGVVGLDIESTFTPRYTGQAKPVVQQTPANVRYS